MIAEPLPVFHFQTSILYDDHTLFTCFFGGRLVVDSKLKPQVIGAGFHGLSGNGWNVLGRPKHVHQLKIHATGSRGGQIRVGGFPEDPPGMGIHRYNSIPPPLYKRRYTVGVLRGIPGTAHDGH